MAMMNLPRWLAPAVLASSLGMAALMPGTARASDDLVRVLVDVADVIYHSGQPYYRYGDYGRYDRVVIVRDRYHRPTYYRYVPRDYRAYHRGPPYGRAYGYHGKHKYKHKKSHSDYRYYERYGRYDGRDRRDDGDWGDRDRHRDRDYYDD